MSDLICRKTMMRCYSPGMCAPYGGCQPSILQEASVRYSSDSGEPVKRVTDEPMIDAGKFIDYVWELRAERDQLRAELSRIKAGQGEVRLISYALDMSTCTLCNGDGSGYFYDRIHVGGDSRRPAPDATQVMASRELLDSCQYELASWMRDHGDDIKSRKVVDELRALLAQSEGVKP